MFAPVRRIASRSSSVSGSADKKLHLAARPKKSGKTVRHSSYLFVGSGRRVRRRGTGALAQLGEHLLCKQGVIGSIPIRSTKTGGSHRCV